MLSFTVKNYFQIKLCTMGPKCDSTYSNIFMTIFEENYIYRLFQEKLRLYLNYINDIFLTWTSKLQELNKFMLETNQIHPSAQFDLNFKTLKYSVQLLDATLQK